MQTQKHGGDDGRYGKRLPDSMARFRCWLIPHVTFLHFLCAVPAPRTQQEEPVGEPRFWRIIVQYSVSMLHSRTIYCISGEMGIGIPTGSDSIWIDWTSISRVIGYTERTSVRGRLRRPILTAQTYGTSSAASPIQLQSLSKIEAKKRIRTCRPITVPTNESALAVHRMHRNIIFRTKPSDQPPQSVSGLSVKC